MMTLEQATEFIDKLKKQYGKDYKNELARRTGCNPNNYDDYGLVYCMHFNYMSRGYAAKRARAMKGHGQDLFKRQDESIRRTGKKIRLTEGNLKRIVNESVKMVLNEEFGWNEEIFRDDMRGYIMANRGYDGSVSAANSRHSILNAVYGDLPWEVSQYDFFNQVIMRLSYGPNIDDQVEFAVNWVKNKFNGRRR